MDRYEDEDHSELPPESIRDYEQSPVAGEPLLEQVDYWRRRARFFENQAYGMMTRLQDIERDDDSEWWKRDED